MAREAPSFELPERFVVFVGKLEENKGARHLVPAIAASGTGLPLVVLGEGTLAHAVKMDAAEAGVPLLLRGWAEREDVLRILARATALVFPSLWPEPLSRVLLEALALGVPVAAMETGGTTEILGPGGGLLVRDAEALGDALRRIVTDAGLRDDLRAAARERARAYAPGGARAALRGRLPEARLRVALLARAAHPLHPPGGMERAVYELARHLQAKGVETTLVTRTRTEAGAFPGRVIEVPYGDGALGRHGSVLDRTLRYPRFAARAGRGGGGAGARSRDRPGGRAGTDRARLRAAAAGRSLAARRRSS